MIDRDDLAREVRRAQAKALRAALEDDKPSVDDPGWQRGPYNPNHNEGTP